MNIRRPIIGLLFALLVVASTPSASAFNSAAFIVGHPTTALRGATEAEFRLVKGCGSIPSTQGLDGLVVDLGSNNYLDLVSSSPSLHHLNYIFYADGNCSSSLAYNSLPIDETQLVIRTGWHNYLPAGYRYLVVSAQYGANITVNWEACTRNILNPPPCPGAP